MKKIENGKRKRETMKKIIIIILILITSCKQNEKGKEYIVYYQGTKKVQKTYKKLKGILIDTMILYDTTGRIHEKYIYLKGNIKERQLFKEGSLRFKFINNGDIFGYDNGILISIFESKDSTSIFFYKNGAKKLYNKWCGGKVVYSNEFDSLTNEITLSYRDVKENIQITHDSITIQPYFDCKDLKMENFSYSIIFNEGNDKLEKIYSQKSRKPIFKFKLKKKMFWTKKICDSLGCFSTNFEVENNR